MRGRLIVSLLLGFASLGGLAQDTGKDIRTRATLFGVGFRNTLDTYFTPYNYKGVEVRFLQERERSIKPIVFGKKFKRRWKRISSFSLDVDFCGSPSGESDILGGMFQYEMSWLLPFRLGGRWNLHIGPAWCSHLGFAYNTLGGNNPAQAYVATNIGVDAVISYTLSSRLSLRLKGTMPCLGVMFSPNYTQSYYEIFSLGNYDHNVCFTNLFQAFSARGLLTLDIKLRSSTLRLGYLCEIRQSEVNSLKRHDWSHLFVIGYVKRFKVLDP